MRIGKVSIQFVLGMVFLFAGCGGAQSGPMTVMNGSQLPQDQGWLVSKNTVSPLDVVTNGRTLTINTIGVPRKNDQRPGEAVVWFYKEVPFDFDEGFTIEFTLKVHEVEQSPNLNDAGIMFYGSTINPSSNFAGGPRDQMIFFEEGAIGWGDETERFAMDTTDTFHAYILAVDEKGVAEVYVDGKRRLKRKKWESIPRIGFGDMTNDSGVNGRFSIGDIIVTTPSQTTLPSPFPADTEFLLLDQLLNNREGLRHLGSGDPAGSWNWLDELNNRTIGLSRMSKSPIPQGVGCRPMDGLEL